MFLSTLVLKIERFHKTGKLAKSGLNPKRFCIANRDSLFGLTEIKTVNFRRGS